MLAARLGFKFSSTVKSALGINFSRLGFESRRDGGSQVKKGESKICS
jgi:hypothetical protein